MNKEIPEEYQNTFNSFEEFRIYSVEKATKQLEKALDKIEIDKIKDWKKTYERFR
jgi:hypothetical protein|tara:strand:- start:358 stop:522 length:165 start_codon:yes stop_codon:yes gene_type:complete